LWNEQYSKQKKRRNKFGYVHLTYEGILKKRTTIKNLSGFFGLLCTCFSSFFFSFLPFFFAFLGSQYLKKIILVGFGVYVCHNAQKGQQLDPTQKR